jgi:hypothetical protein
MMMRTSSCFFGDSAHLELATMDNRDGGKRRILGTGREERDGVDVLVACQSA